MAQREVCFGGKIPFDITFDLEKGKDDSSYACNTQMLLIQGVWHKADRPQSLTGPPVERLAEGFRMELKGMQRNGDQRSIIGLLTEKR